jgi:hypothetical protein
MSGLEIAANFASGFVGGYLVAFVILVVAQRLGRISPGTTQRFDDIVDLPLGVGFLVLAMWNAYRGHWVHSGLETIWAAYLLRRWWHRRGRKRAAKVAARIRDLGHRLVVVPVGGGAR